MLRGEFLQRSSAMPSVGGRKISSFRHIFVSSASSSQQIFQGNIHELRYCGGPRVITRGISTLGFTFLLLSSADDIGSETSMIESSTLDPGEYFPHVERRSGPSWDGNVPRVCGTAISAVARRKWQNQKKKETMLPVL